MEAFPRDLSRRILGGGIGSKEAEVGRRGLTVFDGGSCVKLRIFNFREGHQMALSKWGCRCISVGDKGEQGRDCPSEQQGLSAEEEVCNGFLLLLLFITGHGPSSPGPAFSHLILYVKCQVLCSFEASWRCRRVSDLTWSGCPVGLDGLFPYCLDSHTA